MNTISAGLEHTRKICGTGKENNFTSNDINKMPPLETPREGDNKPKTFTNEEVLEELHDILFGAKDKVNFRFRTGSNLVDVYIGESLNYIINRNLYFKLMGDE